jgi:hypothetical protein
MSRVPVTLKDLGAFWTSHGGVSLGVVGDTDHEKRASYHNGGDVIQHHGRTSATDYTIRTERDHDGLTDAASGIDLGRLGKTDAGLRTFSKWLVAQARADAPGTSDIREIIYSDDGKRVLRWDRERGHTSEPRTGEGDDTHLWHTHVSFYRDSEKRDKVGAFAGFFQGGDMAIQAPESLTSDYVVDVPAGRSFYWDGECSRRMGPFESARTLPYVGATIGESVEGGSRAVIHVTGRPYADKVARPTVVWVRTEQVGKPRRV